MSSVKLEIPKIATCNSQSTLLKLIRDQGSISRSRLVDYSDQSLAAISRTISHMMANQTVLEIPMGDDTGPRKKRALTLNPNLGYCLAIHYGPDEMGIAAINTAYGLIKEKQKTLSLKSMSKQERIKTFVKFIRQFQSRLPDSAGPCLALGLVDPGVSDEKNRSILMSSILDNWTQVPITEIMEKEFKIPAILVSTNNANIRAVDRLELKNKFENFIYIEYQSGISCGIKLQGNYITGRSNLAGEFGHLKVTDQPIPCRCGSVGCLEAVAALPALTKKLQDFFHNIPEEQTQPADKFDQNYILHAAASGNRPARRIVEEAFDYLGNAIGGLVNIMAPDAVVLDHRISLAGPEALDVLLQSARKSMLSAHIKKTEIQISQLKSNISALGGAFALLDSMIDY